MSHIEPISPLFAATGIKPPTEPRQIPKDPTAPGAGEIRPCRSCGAEVIWALTENGKWCPFDIKLETGLFVIDAAGVAHGVKVRKSHSETCRNRAG